MCGIVGYWDSNGVDKAVVNKMALQIQSRGPDDTGVWLDERAGLALAHRRLSIIDLSAAGHQPMISPCGRYTLIYNGEIYNYLELRDDLEREGGHFDWRGHSDTETLLAALRHWGVEETLQRLNGMFAFALWDKIERNLFLARDRMGEKPLYYGHCGGGTFFFGSELKSLTVHPRWRGTVDRDALTLYMRHNYVPSPWCIYKDMYKLPPAHYVVVRDRGVSVSGPYCYWNLGKIAEKGTAEAKGTPEELISELDTLLRDAVHRRMAADVPLGAFLSGGYDSSMIAALMQAQSTQPIKTFTIGFHEQGYNEAEHAKIVANYLGTDHTELYVTPREAMAVIPQLSSIWDEPFADSSQIPTFLVSKLTRKNVVVSLSGDGGDELFFGYQRYTQGYTLWRKLRLLPVPLRRVLGTLIKALPGPLLERLIGHFPKYLRFPHLADRLPKLAEVVKETTGESYYHQLVSHWKAPEEIITGGKEPHTLFSTPELWPALPGLREKMMYIDMMTYLPDDILTKVDRATMSVGLEARVPLLDHRVVEFSWRVPMSLKYRDGKGKWLFREVLFRYIPRELLERPKKGFGVPLDHWLRGPLRDWAEELLDEKRLREEGFFNPVPIRCMWHEHVRGERRWHYYLWDVLMFQSWLEKWGK